MRPDALSDWNGEKIQCQRDSRNAKAAIGQWIEDILVDRPLFRKVLEEIFDTEPAQKPSKAKKRRQRLKNKQKREDCYDRWQTWSHFGRLR